MTNPEGRKSLVVEAVVFALQIRGWRTTDGSARGNAGTV